MPPSAACCSSSPPGAARPPNRSSQRRCRPRPRSRRRLLPSRRPQRRPRPAAAKAKAATPKAPAKPAPLNAVRTIPPTGFPVAVDRALARHKVVVVSLVVPGSPIDELAAGEAKAGAKLGGAGYLALNVLNERVAHAVLAKLEGPKEPSVLVFKQSGEVALALDGFVDRETVAQAAANAAP